MTLASWLLMRRLFLALVIACFPLSVWAQVVSTCDWRASARAVVEPWEENSRTFANGAIRVALLDIIEPAAGASYLLILTRPYDEMGDRQCFVIGFGDGVGYADMSFSELASAYDPARGLILTIPGQIYLPEESFRNSALLEITVNQATGIVAATSTLGGE
ncbi:MAG: hypothetical protein ACI86S_002461 [Paracoccaceae bacterium]|jgi:hypothetical protein